MLAGGVLYTAGALSYHRRWPNPSPRVFGYHEVFHVYVSCPSSTTATPRRSAACLLSTGTSSCGSRSAWHASGSCTASRGGRDDSSVQRTRVRHRRRDLRRDHRAGIHGGALAAGTVGCTASTSGASAAAGSAPRSPGSSSVVTCTPPTRSSRYLPCCTGPAPSASSRCPTRSWSTR